MTLASSDEGLAMSTTLPEKFPHIFFEVAFQLLQEINYDDLVYLSLLVKAQQREPVYSPLVDAVPKDSVDEAVVYRCDDPRCRVGGAIRWFPQRCS
jgi:hypothetical protein